MTQTVSTHRNRAGELGSVTIERRFNGPWRFANGGYSAGRFAEAVGGSPARVVLRSPVPLQRRIDLVADGEGAAVAVVRRRVIAEVSALGDEVLDLPPVIPSRASAELAMHNHPFVGVRHALSGCFACSPSRPDGLGIVPGPVLGDRDILASVFRVPGTGSIASEFVWAALDCTSYPAQAMREVRLCLLGTIAVRQLRAIEGGEELVVVGWTKGSRARTYRTGSALVDERGAIAAVAESVWVAVRR